MLLIATDRRTERHNYELGFATALAAGAVNVCSVIAFFAFASNVTGHFAIFAEELVKGHWHQVTFVLLWLFAFFCGAFYSNFVVVTGSLFNRRVASALPLVTEAVVLAAVGWYGHYQYMETLSETEWLVAALLFAMGMQNGLVATVSGGVVKTTHLTGLLTDLGTEAAQLLNPWHRENATVRFKFKLHWLILTAYLIGGIFAGWLFLSLGFLVFIGVAAVLAAILAYDVMMLGEMTRLSGSQVESAVEGRGDSKRVLPMERMQASQEVYRG